MASHGVGGPEVWPRMGALRPPPRRQANDGGDGRGKATAKVKAQDHGCTLGGRRAQGKWLLPCGRRSTVELGASASRLQSETQECGNICQGQVDNIGGQRKWPRREAFRADAIKHVATTRKETAEAKAVPAPVQ